MMQEFIEESIDGKADGSFQNEKMVLGHLYWKKNLKQEWKRGHESIFIVVNNSHVTKWGSIGERYSIIMHFLPLSYRIFSLLRYFMIV